MFRFDLTNKLGVRPTRIGLDKQMHVIRHYFAWIFIASNVAASATIQRSPLHAICHHRTTVVRTPNHVIQAEKQPRYSWRIAVSMPGSIIPAHITGKRTALPLSACADSPRAQELDAQGGHAVVR
jgi:hypothetical protein